MSVRRTIETGDIPVKAKMLVAALVLVSCGGESFVGFNSTLADTDGGPGGAPTEADAGTGGAVDSDSGSGGASGGTQGSGGAPTSTGGAPVTTGGSSAGGVSGSGGSPVSTGGTPSSGGTPSFGGSSGSGGSVACTLVTHDNGLGQTWQDCVPLDTFNQAQAMKACGASGAGTCAAINRCGGVWWEVDGYTTDGSDIIGFWIYGGPPAGYVATSANGAPPCGAQLGPNVHLWH